MKDLGLLIVRLAVGSLQMGHGAQKLFGSFGGYGLDGTAGWLESMGLKPGKAWAGAAGLSEFGGGLLTALGLLTPLGSIGILSAMGVATGKVHWNKPIWVTEGGAELPLTNMAVATALLVGGPGRLSLDEALGTKLPKWLIAIAALLAILGVAKAVSVQPEAEATSSQEIPESPSILSAERLDTTPAKQINMPVERKGQPEVELELQFEESR